MDSYRVLKGGFALIVESNSSKGLFTWRWGGAQVGEVTRLVEVTRLSI